MFSGRYQKRSVAWNGLRKDIGLCAILCWHTFRSQFATLFIGFNEYWDCQKQQLLPTQVIHTCKIRGCYIKLTCPELHFWWDAGSVEVLRHLSLCSYFGHKIERIPLMQLYDTSIDTCINQSVDTCINQFLRNKTKMRKFRKQI